MKRAWFVFLIYGALTIALTYPLVLHLRSVIPSHAGDTALNTWILWWSAKSIPLTPAWWNAPLFYPASGVLGFSEHLLGLSLIATPLQWLNVGPQTAYNIVLLLTFPLSAFGAYLLTLELTQRRDAAFLAGLLFGFAPYRIAQLDHLQVLASFPMPFALLGLHRSLHDPRWRWLALFAAGWLLQGLCNGYYLMFFSLLVGFWMFWFASPWSRPKQFIAAGTAWLIAALLILPLLLQYRQIHQTYGFARDLHSIKSFSADAAALLQSDRFLRLWGWLDVFPRPEGDLFPGLTITLLILGGVFFLRSHNQPVPVANGATAPLRRSYVTRSVFGFYALAAFGAWLLCLGPAPTLMGHPAPFRGPYALLMFLPGFNSLRVPARFWMVATLCLAVVGAIIFDRLTARCARRRSLFAAVVSLGILADTWLIAMPMASPPQPFPAASCAAADSRGAVLELPLKDEYSNIAAVYRQMSHGRPLVNGYSGYFPPHFVVLRLGLSLRDPDMLTQLAALGVTDLIVNRELDPGGRWDDYAATHPTAELICTEGRQTLYRLSAGPAPPAQVPGEALPIVLIRTTINSGAVPAMTDGDRSTQWGAGRQREGTAVEVDLGDVRMVGGLELSLGPFPEAFPRESVIEASEDGESWREVWSGNSAGLAFAGAIEAPLNVPVRYRFPPTPARKLRMRLTANDDIYHWAITELKVIGP